MSAPVETFGDLLAAYRSDAEEAEDAELVAQLDDRLAAMRAAIEAVELTDEIVDLTELEDLVEQHGDDVERLWLADLWLYASETVESICWACDGATDEIAHTCGGES